MKCEKCGTVNDINAVFCQFCGTQLSGFKENLYQENEKQKKKRLIIKGVIGLILVCFVGGLIYGYFYFRDYYDPASLKKRICEAIKKENYNELATYLAKSSVFQTKDKLSQLFNSNSCRFENDKIILADKEYTYQLEASQKKLLLFSDYKIRFIDLSISEWEIKVPHQATLKVDGRIIEDVSKTDQYYDYYLLKRLYKTSYQLIVEHPGLKTIEETLKAGSTINFEYKLDLSDDFLSKFVEKAYGFNFLITSYNELIPYVTDNFEKKLLLEISRYKQVIQTTMNNYLKESVDLDNYEFVEFRVNSIDNRQVKVLDNGLINANISYNYDIKYMDKNDETKKIITINDNSDLTMQFEKVDDHLLINGFGV